MNKINKKDNTNISNFKVLTINIIRVSKKTCNTKKYVKQNITIYYTN